MAGKAAGLRTKNQRHGPLIRWKPDRTQPCPLSLGRVNPIPPGPNAQSTLGIARFPGSIACAPPSRPQRIRTKWWSLMFYVYTDWCGWCKRMDRVVYSDPKVASLGSEVVFLKLNAEDRGEGQQFARQNGVHSFPTTMILDRKGSVINKTRGYIGSPDQFISLVERSKAGR